GGAREIVLDGETGLLVRPKDPTAIANAVLSLAASPERRRQMGVAARERARQQFDLSKHAERVQSLYQELAPRVSARTVSPPSTARHQPGSRVAIVWDHLATAGGAGGAERTLEALHEMFPDAPIYTTIYNSERMPAACRSWDIRPSFLQRMPFARTHYAPYLPLMPMAVEQFDLRPFDLVISGSFFAAKGALTRPDATHLCYCFTPSRYLWELRHEYLRLQQFNLIERALIPPLMTSLRVWDEASARRVDSYVAISSCVADRIRKHYRREAIVVAPPVDVSRFHVDRRAVEDFYLIVGRMVSYKRMDLAIQAFNASGRALVVIGDGVERSRLQRQAGPTIRFLGRQPDEIVAHYFTRCKAFIFPAEEDFGITAVEAQAAGRPVIAYRRGGAMDTIVDGATGGFFDEQTVDALNRAIEAFDFESFDPAAARSNAERFDRARFQTEIRALTAGALHATGTATDGPSPT
ncbi:MAG: glycosyl transferase, group 1, partial [Chloroflexi bacterium]|nr:glycosyl transferase, group 1 [Chloroflexota bacterium]